MEKSKHKKSLVSSIMLLCVVIVVITAVSIGFNAVLTVKKLSYSSYDTYKNAVNYGQTGNINSQRHEVTNVLDTLNNLAQDNATMTQETAAVSVELSQVVESSAAIIEELEEKVTLLTEDIHKFTL